MLDGRKVKAARRRQFMTQIELAEKVGCDNNTISRLEKGRISVSPVLAKKIADALGMKVDDLSAPVVPSGALVAESEIERDVLEIMRRVGDDGAREIRAYAIGFSAGGSSRAGEFAAAVERKRIANSPSSGPG